MNVKPGDLAIVCGPTRYTGHIVEVINIWDGGPIDGVNMLITEGNIWVCRMMRAIDYRGSIMFYGPFPDAWLRPVSGLPDAEHTDEREPIKELA